VTALHVCATPITGPVNTPPGRTQLIVFNVSGCGLINIPTRTLEPRDIGMVELIDAVQHEYRKPSWLLLEREFPGFPWRRWLFFLFPLVLLAQDDGLHHQEPRYPGGAIPLRRDRPGVARDRAIYHIGVPGTGGHGRRSGGSPAKAQFHGRRHAIPADGDIGLARPRLE
jgi:hypothetical protein